MRWTESHSHTCIFNCIVWPPYNMHESLALCIRWFIWQNTLCWLSKKCFSNKIRKCFEIWFKTNSKYLHMWNICNQNLSHCKIEMSANFSFYSLKIFQNYVKSCSYLKRTYMLKISTIADFFMESLTENNKNIKVYVKKVYVIITKKNRMRRISHLFDIQFKHGFIETIHSS